jgi:DNA mismatch endonuclease (patch repair protein)
LPGSPDIVLPRLCTVVFVNGCFWHMHHCPNGRVKPKTRAEFWENKRQGNVRRDRRNVRRLRRDEWRVLTVWECQTLNVDRLAQRLVRELGKPAAMQRRGPA